MRTRKNPILGRTKDVDGTLWNIREIRDTPHGFDLYYGKPTRGFKGGGPNRLIATEALRNFWEENKVRGHGFLFDLPAGRTTLKRMRRRLGFNYLSDADEFYQARAGDLKRLSKKEFASKHSIKSGGIANRRIRIVGRIARQIGWWRKPKIIALLLSDRTLREIGQKLGISTSQVHRLRSRAAKQR